jgi:hypothetical protein
VVLRLAEAATLASAAGLRAVSDLTRRAPTPPQTSLPPDPGEATTTGTPEADVVPEGARDEPLVPRWDELSLAKIRGRLPRLGIDELESLLAYEHAHAARPQVLTMLDNRIQKVGGGPRSERTDEGRVDGAADAPDIDQRLGREEG